MEADEDRHFKKEKYKGISKVRKKPKNGNMEWRWILIIVVFSFFISIALSFISSEVLENIGFGLAIILVLIIIAVGIIFDIIGTAVTTADEKPFHAMASRKVKGAREAIRLIRNVNKVASMCNDVVGDICGILSGAVVTYIVVSIGSVISEIASVVTALVLTGLVSAMTIGGKAIGKIIALNKSEIIVLKVGVIVKLATGRK